MFEGLPQVVQELDFIPHGVCSQNCSTNIGRLFERYGLASAFKTVIGYSDISFSEQKPNPAGFIKCLKKMGLKGEQLILYIGDHEQDVQFAKNAQLALEESGENITVLSIAVCYDGRSTDSWSAQPDYCAHTVQEIKQIAQELMLEPPSFTM